MIALTAASFYLNGVFAFAISKPGKPEIRPAFGQANRHLRVILPWGCLIGFALAFSSLIATRWGRWPFAISQSIVVGLMMLLYLAVPARIVGIEKSKNTRDKLAATAVGGAVGAVVCSPPYMLGRLGILMLGWHYLFWLGIILIVIGATLQTAATTRSRRSSSRPSSSARRVKFHSPRPEPTWDGSGSASSKTQDRARAVRAMMRMSSTGPWCRM